MLGAIGNQGRAEDRGGLNQIGLVGLRIGTFAGDLSVTHQGVCRSRSTPTGRTIPKTSPFQTEATSELYCSALTSGIETFTLLEQIRCTHNPEPADRRRSVFVRPQLRP